MAVRVTGVMLGGLAATLAVAALFSSYSLNQLNGLRQIQAETIDRNRRDSLQLIRLQNDLNQLGLSMRDMIDDQEGYGIPAWRGEFGRLRTDLDDALQRGRAARQRPYLLESLDQFWRSADQIFAVADAGQKDRAVRMIVDSLQAQQAALSNTVARLLVQNNEAEEAAAREVREIYDKAERNIYLFLTAMLASMTAIGLGVAHYNRKLFDRMATLSEQRSTLTRRLFGVQEEVFRSVARELHDDFGQILTAIGLMIRRKEDISEVKQVVQEAIEKTRAFSQALHPTILEDCGIEYAVERHVQNWEKQSGIAVDLQIEGTGRLPDGKAIHIYRIVQEALNNTAKHSGATEAEVRIEFEEDKLLVRVADNGKGLEGEPKTGLGLVAMRERAELLKGHITITRRPEGGTLVSLEVPINE